MPLPQINPVSEGLNSVETIMGWIRLRISDEVSEGLNSVETTFYFMYNFSISAFQKDLIVWKQSS